MKEGVLLYKSDITKEMFKEVISMLEKEGLKKYGADADYKGFKRHGGLRWDGTDWMTCVRRVARAEEKEVPITFFLGQYYDSHVSSTPTSVIETVLIPIPKL